MATQGPNVGSATSTTILGPVGWNDTNNALAQDDVGATASGLGPTHWMNVTGYGFAVPDGSTVTDLAVVVRALDDAAQGVTMAAQLLSSGAAIGDEKTGITTTASYVNYSLSGAPAHWNTTLTPAIVNAAGFGVRVRSTNSLDEFNTLRVDVVTVTITYTGGSATTSRLKLRKVG